MLAERISRLARGQDADAVLHIGKIDDPPSGWTRIYFVKTCAVIGKSKVVDYFPSAFHRKWTYVEIAS